MLLLYVFGSRSNKYQAFAYTNQSASTNSTHDEEILGTLKRWSTECVCVCVLEEAFPPRFFCQSVFAREYSQVRRRLEGTIHPLLV